MTTDTPTPADQLHAYYQLSDRVVPGGFAWPEEIKETDDEIAIEDGERFVYELYPRPGGWAAIKQHHALAIVERAAEDWLESKGWVWESGHSMRAFTLNGYVTTHNSLPDALAAENGRGG